MVSPAFFFFTMSAYRRPWVGKDCTNPESLLEGFWMGAATTEPGAQLWDDREQHRGRTWSAWWLSAGLQGVLGRSQLICSAPPSCPLLERALLLTCCLYIVLVPKCCIWKKASEANMSLLVYPECDQLQARHDSVLVFQGPAHLTHLAFYF